MLPFEDTACHKDLPLSRKTLYSVASWALPENIKTWLGVEIFLNWNQLRGCEV